MSAINSITVEKLARLVGTPGCPALIDVATSGEGLIPGSVRRSADTVAEWALEFGQSNVVVVCAKGEEKSAGAAAWLRHFGVKAEILEGGIAA